MDAEDEIEVYEDTNLEIEQGGGKPSPFVRDIRGYRDVIRGLCCSYRVVH